MFRTLKLALHGLALVLCLAISLGVASAQTRVNTITVDGNQRVPDSTIVSLIGAAPGEVLSADQINDAVQRIMGSGLFETAEIQPVSGGLRVTVVERPTVNRISIEGNRRVNDDDLLPLIELSPRRVFSARQAEADAATLAEAYSNRARLAATVTPRIIRRTDNRVDVVFEVSEGRVVENERISFVGNREFSDRRLRRVIDTKQAGFLRQLIQRDTFIAERIAFDRQLLTDFYRSRGYVDFQVLDVSTQLSRERDATFVTFNVREGQSFDVGAVSVTSEFAEMNLDEYRRALRIRSGQTWSPNLIDEQVNRLERLATRQGFDFARVDPRVTRNARDLTLDVEFAIVRGPRVFVERIDIEGNQTTLDRVVRRQFDTVEGDPFNPREIRNAAERIRALGFFETVDVQTREGTAPDQVVVDVDVEEQPTGNLSFGGSFSDESGFALAVGFSERNFLGRGQALSVDVVSGGEDRRANISFSEPAFLGRDLTFGLDIEYEITDFDEATYETEVAAFSPSLAFPVAENARLRLYYQIADEDIFNVSGDASPIIVAEQGSQVRSSVGYTFAWDRLRGGLNPNRGVLLTFGQEFAGLGGDTEYLKTTARIVAQRDILNEEVTLRAILEGGNVQALGGGTTRVTDRFFLSSRQLRGFSSRGVGPRDTGAANSDVLGGNSYAALRLEADFPLGLPEEYGISGGVFLDAGSLWDLDNTAGVATVDDGFELRTSIGVSIFWDTPIGPLRLNFAQPLESNPLDDEKSFDITISTQF
ncbi:MAG: outer membrane protein assembly factor BamA [Paracoccaceae bacterium]|nr:outer membrane protein assembly factor BamA [Paracoccaceae bacterium]